MARQRTPELPARAPWVPPAEKPAVSARLASMALGVLVAFPLGVLVGAVIF